MMRSLWSGVSGLYAHQIAMDVEGNNISNVNTFGFKYSRANFSDMLNQTAKIATGPDGELGGTNPMQIGLGTSINSVTKIFKQGSVQTTDKNTDLAIEGDGFFIISPDGGRTYKYTRNGDFIRDAAGKLVDNNGYTVQGWVRDEETGYLDSTTPIKSIIIPPGLTSPARATSEITLKANLNSGSHVEKKNPIYSLDSHHGWVDMNKDGIKSNANELHLENNTSIDKFDTDGNMIERAMDMGVLFNEKGDALHLRRGQGTWVSYADAKSTMILNRVGTDPFTVDMELNGRRIVGTVQNIPDLVGLINAQSGKTGVEAQLVGTKQLELINTNRQGTEASSKNIKLTVNSGGRGAGAAATDYFGGLESTTVITAYQYTYDPNSVTADHEYNDAIARRFHTTEDLREAMQKDARLWTNYEGDRVGGAVANYAYTNEGGATVNVAATAQTFWDRNAVAFPGGAGVPGVAGEHGISDKNKNDGVEITVNEKGQFEVRNPKGDAFNTDDGDLLNTGTYVGEFVFSAGDYSNAIIVNNGPDDIHIPNPGGATDPITIAAGATFTFPAGPNSILLTDQVVDLGTTGITVNKGVLENPVESDDHEMKLTVTALTNEVNGVGENVRLKKSLGGLEGILPLGTAVRSSQGFYAASAGATEDIFDSLGSKHSLHMQFTKIGYTDDGGTEWGVKYTVPEPGIINFSGDGPKNIVTGRVKFGPNGALISYSPTSLTFTGNNGSSPNQNVELNFGVLGEYDGLTSYDAKSSVSDVYGDGYTGGELYNIAINETGTVVAGFTNGQYQSVAQIATAKFTNNSGLESEGGNVFIQTANSGKAVIGTAATGGRGKIHASKIEMSNVDLSRSLTQLIVVQRGFQANSKTITTSDQMLNTLLQLKQ